MNVVDLVRGIGTIFFIMCVAGAVAYVGDRVGHQVGRRRLTLFNIRPRYTSTIVAIATGMLIALVVMLGAILASRQVQTAFFRLDDINREIVKLQNEEQQLEAKVTNGRLVVPTGTLMVPFAQVIKPSFTSDERLAAITSFVSKSVELMNASAQIRGLKKFKPPADFEKQLRAFSDDAKMQGLLAQGDVLLTIASDQNLFVNDPIHFVITVSPDNRVFQKDQPVAALKIPGDSGANPALAISELETLVADAARSKQMPDYLATNMQVAQVVPGLDEMQKLVARPGTYYLTAYAAEDVYPHAGLYHIVVTLGLQPKK